MLTGETHQLIDPRQSLSQVVLFSIGGGSYHEYENLKITLEQLELEDERQRDASLGHTKIIYGCDHIFQLVEFMNEILKL